MEMTTVTAMDVVASYFSAEIHLILMGQSPEVMLAVIERIAQELLMRVGPEEMENHFDRLRQVVSIRREMEEMRKKD